MKEKQGYRFGLVSIVNHWITAILFLSILSLGFTLEFFGAGRALRGPWMEVHKAAGVVFFMFGIWRLMWRYFQGFPKDTFHMPAWQHIMAKLVHWMLMFAIIAMPLSGILMSLYSERSINVFGLFSIPGQPENELINRTADAVHWTLSYMVALAIFMHAGAALKHHIIDRDDALWRMLRPKGKVKPKTRVKRKANPAPKSGQQTKVQTEAKPAPSPKPKPKAAPGAKAAPKPKAASKPNAAPAKKAEKKSAPIPQVKKVSEQEPKTDKESDESPRPKSVAPARRK